MKGEDVNNALRLGKSNFHYLNSQTLGLDRIISILIQLGNWMGFPFLRYFLHLENRFGHLPDGVSIAHCIIM